MSPLWLRARKLFCRSSQSRAGSAAIPSSAFNSCKVMAPLSATQWFWDAASSCKARPKRLVHVQRPLDSPAAFLLVVWFVWLGGRVLLKGELPLVWFSRGHVHADRSLLVA